MPKNRYAADTYQKTTAQQKQAVQIALIKAQQANRGLKIHFQAQSGAVDWLPYLLLAKGSAAGRTKNHDQAQPAEQNQYSKEIENPALSP
jgi:hypothetical protein